MLIVTYAESDIKAVYVCAVVINIYCIEGTSHVTEVNLQQDFILINKTVFYGYLREAKTINKLYIFSYFTF